MNCSNFNTTPFEDIAFNNTNFAETVINTTIFEDTSFNNTTSIDGTALNLKWNDGITVTVEMLSLLRKLFYSIIIPVVTLIGLFGNTSTMVIFWRTRKMKTLTASLFFLTVTDFTFLCFSSVTVTIQNLKIYQPAIGQKVQAILASEFMTLFYLFRCLASVLPFLISIERLILIAFPFQAKYILTKKFCLAFVICTFLFISAWFVPYAFVLEYQVIRNVTTGNEIYIIKETAFGKRKDLLNGIKNAEVILYRIIPVFTTILINIMIIILLLRNLRQKISMNSHKISDETREMRVTKTTVIVTIVYTLCGFPTAISRLIVIADVTSENYAFSSNAQRLFSIITFNLDIINSSFNFIIYFLTNNRYRQEYRRLFCCYKNTVENVTLKRCTSTEPTGLSLPSW